MTFQNAILIGSGIDPQTYIRQVEGVTRGHPDYVYSRSDLIQILECPHKWLLGSREDSDTKATEWGSLIDTLFLEPEKFTNRYVVQPDTYDSTVMECPSCKSQTDSKSCRKCGKDRNPVTIQKPWNSNSETCADWEKKQSGRTIISKTLKQNADLAVKTLMDNPDIRELVECSKRQVMVIADWVCPETKIVVHVKGLIDLLPSFENQTWGGTMADLKTTRSANPATWGKACIDQGYLEQATLFRSLYHAASGEYAAREFAHVAQENTHPYEVVYPLPAFADDDFTVGEWRILKALKLVAKCIQNNHWPSYAPAIRLNNRLQIISMKDRTARLMEQTPDHQFDETSDDQNVRQSECNLEEVTP